MVPGQLCRPGSGPWRLGLGTKPSRWARVEVVAEGDAEAVDKLVEWCHDGPPHAQVTGVEVLSEPPQSLIGFTVR